MKWDGQAAAAVRAGALSTIADDSHEDSSSRSDSGSDNEPPGIVESSDDEFVSVKSGAKQPTTPVRQLKKKSTVRIVEIDEAYDAVPDAEGATGANTPVVAPRRKVGPLPMPCEHILSFLILI